MVAGAQVQESGGRGSFLEFNILENATPAQGGTVSCSPNPVMENDSSTCTATPSVGYVFDTWMDDCTGQPPSTCVLSSVSSPLSATAQFRLQSYNISTQVQPTGGGSVSCSPNPVEYGNDSICTATASASYEFSAWSGDCAGQSGSSCTLSNVSSDKTVTAQFSPLSFTISTSANPPEGGSVSCSPNPVNKGDSSVCTATANSGYVFSDWVGACLGYHQNPCTLINVNSALTVTALFAANSPIQVSPEQASLLARVNEPTDYDFASVFTDPEGDTLSYSSDNTFSWLSLQGTQLSGTASAADVNPRPQAMRVTATDPYGEQGVFVLWVRIIDAQGTPFADGFE